MLIIGLVGEKGSGKDTFAQILSEVTDKTIEHIRFSDLLRKTLEIWDISPTRENLQKIAQVLEEFGPGTVAHGLEKEIESANAQIVILDGVRWKPDLELIQKFPDHKLIYITAAAEERYKRLKNRGEKIGESEMDYAQFMKEEKAPNEILIPELGWSADYKIENNGSIDEFREKVKALEL